MRIGRKVVSETFSLPRNLTHEERDQRCFSILNQTTGDSYTGSTSLNAVACAMRTERGGLQDRRAHSARYAGCANVVYFGLEG